ncbi:uncharacterized protein FFB20_00375 [Fusarium fujikuroi]|nr:uncharacterized protein FFB20_00375 [Fusarium fujikuroi]SCN73676.1 uncharacterized protein FFE2_02909 [Fusarium fujikuroi]SCN88332.1 uncharacterized protein FFM5_04359 [Fusarium fujikuroi]SCO04860.1 uncharacterized protein FFC1_09788 [Fusarium fujikuroi]SCO36133.1 uncharacterized protein FFNC_05063 [Fusarium fujikuroi]
MGLILHHTSGLTYKITYLNIRDSLNSTTTSRSSGLTAQPGRPISSLSKYPPQKVRRSPLLELKNPLKKWSAVIINMKPRRYQFPELKNPLKK